MQLYATPRSHFSRKVRLLLDHLEQPYDLIDVGDVANSDPDQFHSNPTMSVPVLKDGDLWMIESDQIARYIANTYDEKDRFHVSANDADHLNARAIMNAVMANEVKLILAERTGLETNESAFFNKAKLVMNYGLSWLEERADLFNPDKPTYTDFHFISMWDHLALHGLIDLEFQSLKHKAHLINQQALIRQSAPPN